jgi:hypothetical protein
VDEAVAELVRERVLSCFPEGTFAWVDVLGYGDDPAVEPGDTAVRAFIDQAGRPEDDRDSKRTIDDFAEANEEGIGNLHDDGLLSSIAWVEFVPDSPQARVRPYDQSFGMTRTFLGKRPDAMNRARGGTHVGTWLGPADLATADALIMAGVASSRSEVIRWALGRIRENPVYTQLEERVRKTEELRAWL